MFRGGDGDEVRKSAINIWDCKALGACRAGDWERVRWLTNISDDRKSHTLMSDSESKFEVEILDICIP